MSAETFVNALFLITAVVAAGILITAVFPIVWNMAGTFSTASHESDTRMRTDFKIVATYAKNYGSLGPSEPSAKIWIKNIGTTRIGKSEIESSDVFIGKVGNFNHIDIIDAAPKGYIQNPPLPPPTLINDKTWSYSVVDSNGNGFWETGETLEINALNSIIDTQNEQVYFQFVLPNGVSRSSEFTTS